MSTVILGGGLSGLSAAHYLLKKSPKRAITLIEASPRTGGWIKSHRQPDGTIFEQGPRTIRPSGPAGINTLQLVEELNVSDQIIPIVSSHPAAKNRLIFAKGSLHLLPTSIVGLFRKQEPFSKPLVLHLLNDLKAERKVVKDESIYDFVLRRFGVEVADYLISPMICGISAGCAQEVSVNFLMKNLFQYEQQYGSIAKGIVYNLLQPKPKKEFSVLASRAAREKWSIYSFIDGCETLPLALERSISSRGVDIQLNTKCTSITFKNDKVIVDLGHKQITADSLISALPAPTLGHLLHQQHPDLATALTNLAKNVTVVVVNLHYKSDFIKSPAFGLLVAPIEGRPILGIIYDSCCFPKAASGTTLTVMMGGHWFEHYFGKNPTEKTLLDTATDQVRQILQTDDKPETYKVSVLHQCLPQYIVGHSENLKFIDSYVQKLPMGICGASYYGVGINDVVLAGKSAADKLA